MSFQEPPDDRSLRPLDDEQVWALAVALRRWADRHPHPHRPLISFGGQRFVSASELALAVAGFPGREESYDLDRVRLQYLRMVQIVLLETSFEDYLRSIQRSGNPRFTPLRWLIERRDLLLLRRRERERQPPPASPAR